MATVPEQWAEKTQYDLDTASAMLESGRYVYVVFCCQQAVEKALKRLIVLRTGEMPPRIHSLTRLAAKARIEVSEGQAELFTRLTSYYIHSQYPEELPAPELIADDALAGQAFRATKEIVPWLLKLTT